MRHAIGSVLLAAWAACGGAPAKSAQPQPAQPTATPAPAPGTSTPGAPALVPSEPVPADPRIAADLKSFDFVWSKVDEVFYDPSFGGVDWKAVRAELRPKILATKTREESRAIMNEALKRLGKSHLGVVGPVEEDSPAVRAGEAGVGVDVRIIGKAAIVTRVERGSAAEKAKLPLGAELISVDKVEVATKLTKIASELEGSPLASHLPFAQVGAVHKMLGGKSGTKAAVTYKAGGRVATKELERALEGTETALGNLGSHRVVYEARKLEPQVGYIRLSIFLDPPMVVPAFGKDLTGFTGTDGVIIDLRGNGGGIAAMAIGMAGHLVAEANKQLGTMRTRDSTMGFVVNPQVQRYAGKVAILVDELSASTTEIFAGGLQDLGRAKVFGRRSAGMALPSAIESLPNGDRFQYVIADYVSSSGKSLEGNGVTPDVPVPLDLVVLRGGKDPDIAAATRWIKEKP